MVAVDWRNIPISLIDPVLNESKHFFCGRIRKLPIPNATSGTQGIQSLRGDFQGIDSGWVSNAAAWPGVNPGLLLGDQALHELGPFLLVGLDALAWLQLSDLRAVWGGSLAAVASNNPIETFAELGRHAQKDLKRRSKFPALDF